jgi:hypothetical protein
VRTVILRKVGAAAPVGSGMIGTAPRRREGKANFLTLRPGNPP